MGRRLSAGSSEHGDLFEGVLTTRQRLDRALASHAVKLAELVDGARRVLPHPGRARRRLVADDASTSIPTRTGASTSVHGWEGHWNGLSMHGAEEVERVVTCVFPSDRIVAGLEPATFLFSEHPVDFADEPGFLPLSLETFEDHARARDQLLQRACPARHASGGLAVAPVRAGRRAASASRSTSRSAQGIPGGAVVVGDAQTDGRRARGRPALVPRAPRSRCTCSRAPVAAAGRVAMVAGGGAMRRDPRGGARARLRDLRDRQRRHQLPARLRPGAGRARSAAAPTRPASR